MEPYCTLPAQTCFYGHLLHMWPHCRNITATIILMGHNFRSSAIPTWRVWSYSSALSRADSSSSPRSLIPSWISSTSVSRSSMCFWISILPVRPHSVSSCSAVLWHSDSGYWHFWSSSLMAWNSHRYMYTYYVCIIKICKGLMLFVNSLLDKLHCERWDIFENFTNM